jgi:hypothetical protein
LHTTYFAAPLPHNTNNMRLARLTQLLFVSAIALAIAVASGCKGHTASPGEKNVYVFAEIQGSLFIDGQQSQVNRQLVISPSGNKVVMSAITSFIELSGYKSLIELDGYETVRIRHLTEFFDGDSVFSFDAGDSSFVALSVSDAADHSLAALPFSAVWVLNNSPASGSQPDGDTLDIAGITCYKSPTTDGYLWIDGQQPLAIETANEGRIHNETTLRLVTDTVFPESIFKHPTGFRRIVPSFQNN